MTEIPAFLAGRVEVTSEGCWRWTGAVQSKGYGSIGIDGKTYLAHRHVYEVLVGPIPVGLQVDHTCCHESGCHGGIACPHRRCVNPEHLEAVTARENRARSNRNRYDAMCAAFDRKREQRVAS